MNQMVQMKEKKYILESLISHINMLNIVMKIIMPQKINIIIFNHMKFQNIK